MNMKIYNQLKISYILIIILFCSCMQHYLLPTNIVDKFKVFIKEEDLSGPKINMDISITEGCNKIYLKSSGTISKKIKRYYRDLMLLKLIGQNKKLALFEDLADAEKNYLIDKKWVEDDERNTSFLGCLNDEEYFVYLMDIPVNRSDKQILKIAIPLSQPLIWTSNRVKEVRELSIQRGLDYITAYAVPLLEGSNKLICLIDTSKINYDLYKKDSEIYHQERTLSTKIKPAISELSIGIIEQNQLLPLLSYNRLPIKSDTIFYHLQDLDTSEFCIDFYNDERIQFHPNPHGDPQLFVPFEMWGKSVRTVVIDMTLIYDSNIKTIKKSIPFTFFQSEYLIDVYVPYGYGFWPLPEILPNYEVEKEKWAILGSIGLKYGTGKYFPDKIFQWPDYLPYCNHSIKGILHTSHYSDVELFCSDSSGCWVKCFRSGKGFPAQKLTSSDGFSTRTLELNNTTILKICDIPDKMIKWKNR